MWTILYISLFIVANNFEIKSYPSDGDFFVGKNIISQGRNKGGNPKLYLDEHKIIGLEFDFDNDFRSHEIEEATLKLYIKQSFGEDKIILCQFLENPKEGDEGYIK